MRMRRPAITAAAAGLAVAAVALVPAAPATAADDPQFIRQAGTYDYLATPDYTGLMPIGTVTKGATLGLGTFDGLTGEFILVGGRGYRVNVDGTPVAVDSTASTPFAEAVHFVPDTSVPVPPGTTCAQLIANVNAAAGTDAGMVAVRVRGTFTGLTTRSVPGFARPYPTLPNAVAQQTTFDLSGRTAVLVGFRTGADFAGVGAAGLHLHGVTADRAAGGHVLNCIAGNDVQLSVQRTAGVTIVD